MNPHKEKVNNVWLQVYRHIYKEPPLPHLNELSAIVRSTDRTHSHIDINVHSHKELQYINMTV